MKTSEISNFLQENYSFFGKNIRVKSITLKESNNKNFLITSKTKKFVFHIINENLFSKQIEKICEILQFCHDNGAKVQSPIKNNKGHFVNKKFLSYLTKYSIGKQSSGKNLELINLAKQLAKLHIVFSKCKISYNFKTNESFYKILNQQEIKKIQNIIKKKSKKNIFDKNVLKNLNLISTFMNKLYSFNSKQKSKSKQLIHFDLHPGNVLFKNNNVVTFLDFNSIRKGIVWEDVAFSSFRFAILSKKHQSISNSIQIFVTTYLKNSKNYSKLPEINNFLLLRILKSISYILRKQYFSNENMSSTELQKYFQFLSTINDLHLK